MGNRTLVSHVTSGTFLNGSCGKLVCLDLTMAADLLVQRSLVARQNLVIVFVLGA